MNYNNIIINETKICSILEKTNNCDESHVNSILEKALELNGLSIEDVATLSKVESKELLQKIFSTAKTVKETIYGKRLVIFAPLYVSNYCSNGCTYCAFQVANKSLKRVSLSQQEISNETKCLIDQGHKRILLLSGELTTQESFQSIIDSIETVYATKTNNGNIRRVNVNIAPLTLENFKLLKQSSIGTYQLFQETYHQKTYKEVHLSGKKTDYEWRLRAIDRAMEAGIDDVGIGVLFGLADWRFEILALLQHIEHLNKAFGIGPHTISVPRLEPAYGSSFSTSPPNPVSDQDFCKIIAILRLAIPYTGIILSTRESIELRRETLALGVSQLSAGSRTNPGGYAHKEKEQDIKTGQFYLGDNRALDDVVYDLLTLGYVPSFCTACYRLGRTGDAFMALAKSGKIKNMCNPNAIITLQEYLINYASQKTRVAGEQLIEKEINSLPDLQRNLIIQSISKLKNGDSDIFV